MTSVHSAFDMRIFGKISRSLAKSRHHVVLIVPHSSDEVEDGVFIKAVPRPSSRYARIFLTTWQVTRAALASGATVCHFHDPELMPAGIALKLLGRKVIYDVHEDYPKTIATKSWLPIFLRNPLSIAIKALEWITALSVDRIVAATPTIALRFPSRKTVVIQNFPIEDELIASGNDHAYATRNPVVAYIGGLTPERGSLEMVQAIGLVHSRFNASLHLAGQIVPASLRDKMQQTAGWDRVVELGFCDRKKVRETLLRSRIGLVVLHPHPNYINALATKMFEYMSAGLPVIASDFPLWREIIAGVNAGLLVDPMNPKAIAEAIEWLLAHPSEAKEMGDRGREAVRAQYNWTQEERKLISTYAELTTVKSTSRS